MRSARPMQVRRRRSAGRVALPEMLPREVDRSTDDKSKKRDDRAPATPVSRCAGRSIVHEDVRNGQRRATEGDERARVRPGAGGRVAAAQYDRQDPWL